MKTDFDRCTRTTEKDGTLCIDCLLNLWSVSGPRSERQQIEREARHYWAQYYVDGEYNYLLNSKPR